MTPLSADELAAAEGRLMLTPEQEAVIEHHGALWQLDHETLSDRCFHAERRLAALEPLARAAVALVQFWADEEAGTHPPGLWDVLDEAGRHLAGLKRAVAALNPALKAELEASDDDADRG